MKKLSVFLLSVATSVSGYSQEEALAGGSLEIGVGFNYASAGDQMRTLMKAHAFDVPSYNLFLGRSVKYPQGGAPGITLHMSYEHYVRPGSQLGIFVSYAPLGTVRGNSSNDAFSTGIVSIAFKSVTIAPFFAYDVTKDWELDAGPAFAMNTAKKVSSGGPGGETYRGQTPGVLMGVRARLWTKRTLHGKLGAFYTYAGSQRMGPFTASNNAYLPAARFGFSSLAVSLSLVLPL